MMLTLITAAMIGGLDVTDEQGASTAQGDGRHRPADLPKPNQSPNPTAEIRRHRKRHQTWNTQTSRS
jgi:hypothetical protein